MSVDLSDPAITAIREAIADPSNPTCWFILHYSQSPSIALFASGEAPVVPAWQTVLGETQEDVLFGYGEIKGKGLVLVFLRDSVGGVRRARAVVHSRAIASLYPDYSALITVAHPSQLTEELVVDRLGLNHPTIQPPPRQASLAARPQQPLPSTSTSTPTENHHTPLPPPRSVSNSQVTQSPSSTQIQQSSPASAAAPTHNAPGKPMVARERDLAAPISLDSPPKYQGISSADYFKDDNARGRKTSFGARLKHTFQRTSSSEEPVSPSHSQPPTAQPTSPAPASPASTSGRFKSSSLAKAFGKRRSSANGNETTPPTSPKLDEFGRGGYGGSDDIAPPVPPKDSQPLTIVETSAAASQATIGHEDRSTPQSSALSPSPSARQALFDARQKSLSHETAIQERFRRDQEERAKREQDDDDDKSVRLAYDESDGDGEEDSEFVPPQGNATIKSDSELDNNPNIASVSVQPPPSSVPALDNGHGDRPKTEDAAELAQARDHENARVAEEQAIAQRAEEERLEAQRREIEQLRLEAEAEQRAKREAEERARREEEERSRLEAEEQARIEAKERERLRLEEDARLQQEEEERRRLQEEERVRAEQEETARRNEEQRLRLEEEKRLRRAEEEKERARIEAEAAKKAAVREQLVKGKREGGVMLRGWVTAQTFKSMTWRRRYFHLIPTEMQLYKAEGDTKPIQTILFGRSSTISEEYEESQVKGSFKVVSDGPNGQEEFFLFTDSADDKEVVIEGIKLCLV